MCLRLRHIVPARMCCSRRRRRALRGGLLEAHSCTGKVCTLHSHPSSLAAPASPHLEQLAPIAGLRALQLNRGEEGSGCAVTTGT